MNGIEEKYNRDPEFKKMMDAAADVLAVRLSEQIKTIALEILLHKKAILAIVDNNVVLLEEKK